MENKILVIKCGDMNAEEQTYFCIDTNAPVDYDGFGTFEVSSYTSNGWQYNRGETEELIRTVVVREEHATWQTQRYHSGNHMAFPTIHEVQDIASMLWKKLSD
jgi:hypothetical protein